MQNEEKDVKDDLYWHSVSFSANGLNFQGLAASQPCAIVLVDTRSMKTHLKHRQQSKIARHQLKGENKDIK